jgi:hypothetical protein
LYSLFVTGRWYYYLNDFVAGAGYDNNGNWQWAPWTVWDMQDLNNHGVILANVSPSYDQWGNLLDWDAAQQLQEPAFLVPVGVESVSFGGTGFHQLWNDLGTFSYSGQQWVSGADGHNWPVAYTRNTKPTVGAVLAVGLPDGTPVTVTASWLGQEQFSRTLTVSGGQVAVPPTEAAYALPDMVDIYDATWQDAGAFEIEWAIGFYGVTTYWYTDHTMYVTWANPIGTVSGSMMRETLFALGCYNAAGLSGTAGSTPAQQDIVDAIYGEFTDREVQRVLPGTANLDGVNMTYWGNPAKPYHSTQDLLSHRDGKCGAWTRFLVDVLRSQGIDATLRDFFAPGESFSSIVAGGQGPQAEKDAYGSAVVAWNFPPNPQRPALPYVNIGLNPVLFVKTWTIGADKWHPIDESGLAAQGNENPQAYFNDHVLVEYAGQLYDPSYGPAAPYPTQQAWEDAALNAFGYDLQHTAQPFPVGFKFWIWKLHTSGMSETVLDANPVLGY